MKKLIFIIAMSIAMPIAAFADWGVGAAAFMKSPVLLGQKIDVDNFNCDQISLGGNVRYKLGWFQAEGLLMYSAGAVNSLNMFLDAGVALDLGIVRLSAGAGPNFANNFGDSFPIQAGMNAKIGAEVMLGPVSCGLSYIMSLNLDNGINVTTGSGLLGAYGIYWM